MTSAAGRVVFPAVLAITTAAIALTGCSAATDAPEETSGESREALIRVQDPNDPTSEYTSPVHPIRNPVTGTGGPAPTCSNTCCTSGGQDMSTNTCAAKLLAAGCSAGTNPDGSPITFAPAVAPVANRPGDYWFQVICPNNATAQTALNSVECTTATIILYSIGGQCNPYWQGNPPGKTVLEYDPNCGSACTNYIKPPQISSP
jgi:hypothetical protein